MERILSPGYYIQPYMDKIPGKTIKEKQHSFSQHMAEFKSLGVSGICWHGFVGGLDKLQFDSWAKMCKDIGMKSLAAYGLNSLNPTQKGEWIGKVANSPLCDGVIFDMEGAWEDEAEDKRKATEMGNAFRSLAPNALALDQPWFAPASHWSMFPWEESAKFIDVRAPQVYCNNFVRQYGNEAYEKVFAWFERDWAKLNNRLASSGLVKPVIITIQGYVWNLTDLITCLTKYDTVIIWCEPYPDSTTLRGLRVVKKLKSLGFSGSQAVGDYQRTVGLTADNICGEKTLTSLGI
jgi:hypothetical protein